MPTVNATHRKRLARALAAQEGITYMAALDAINKAALAGRLPSRLDDAGLQAALRILTTQAPDPAQATGAGPAEVPARRIAADPRDQQIYDLSAAYEAATGQQGLLYISSPGSGKDRYVFGGVGGGHVCLGRDEALTYITGLLNTVPAMSEVPSAPEADGCVNGHAKVEYRAQDGHYCTGCGMRVSSYDGLVATDSFHLEKTALGLLRMVWQGRVAWEKVGSRTPGFRFTIDNEPASDIKDIELRWLHDHGYLAIPPLVGEDEWAVARTTEWGDDVLAFHGADRDKFTDGLPTSAASGTPTSSVRTLTVKFSDIARCPISSLETAHYRPDGTCLCRPATDANHAEDGIDADVAAEGAHPVGAVDVDQAWAQARAVETGEAPSGSTVLKVTGPNSLLSPGTGSTPKSGPTSEPATGDVSPVMTEREAAMLAMVKGHEARLHIAGIVECKTALALVERGLLRIVSGTISDEGGSGIVAPTPTEEADVATTQRPSMTAFVAHEGGENPRCEVSSWRGSSKKTPFGPGGYNRCVMEVGHAGDAHVDEWGNVFTVEPSFRKINMVSQDEVVTIATAAGMRLRDLDGSPRQGSRSGMRVADLRPNLLVQTPANEVLKVSNIYHEDRVSAQVVYPLLPRTTVRFYTAEDVASWREPSKAMVTKYEQAWGFDQ